VTDRYTKAIEQFGSDKLDVRVGGTYALERIAHDSARDHPTVMEVCSLRSYVSAHPSRGRRAAPHQFAASARRADRAVLATLIRLLRWVGSTRIENRIVALRSTDWRSSPSYVGRWPCDAGR
jgi:hypothetical protein